MRKSVIGALVAVLALAFASVAYAIGEGTAANTQTSIAVSKVSSTGGTKKKPKQQPNIRLTIDSKTKSGTGQPATSTAIKTTLPSGWKFNTKSWPKAARCSAAKANAQQSTAACPKGSKVASGSTTVFANAGGIKRVLNLSAYVLTDGNMGTFVSTAPGEAPAVKRMLVGKVSGGTWNVAVDKVVQEPVTGFPTGISELDFKFSNAKTKVKGKTLAIAQSTGCKGGSWTFKVQNTYRDGKGTPATDKVKCKK